MVWLSAPALAQAPTWKLDNAGSHIHWQAVQNGAPLDGGFSKFSAEIAFAPDALESSHVRAVIQTASITTSYDEAQSTLSEPDWFAAKAFPEAVYECSAFTALEQQNQFRCDGTLTIKGQTQPVALTFNLLEYSENSAAIEGQARLNRTAFGIGWSDTKQIADEVKVNISLKASR